MLHVYKIYAQDFFISSEFMYFGFLNVLFIFSTRIIGKYSLTADYLEMSKSFETVNVNIVLCLMYHIEFIGLIGLKTSYKYS